MVVRCLKLDQMRTLHYQPQALQQVLEPGRQLVPDQELPLTARPGPAPYSVLIPNLVLALNLVLILQLVLELNSELLGRLISPLVPPRTVRAVRWRLHHYQ